MSGIHQLLATQFATPSVGASAPVISILYETASVNLTGLGGADYFKAIATGGAPTLERKASGGNLLGFNIPPYTNNNGAYQTRVFTATDSSPTSSFSNNNSIYIQKYNAVDLQKFVITAPAGLIERTVKLYLGYYMTPAVSINLIIKATISGAGAPAPYTFMITPIINADRSLTATITYAAGQDGQTITLEYDSESEAVDGHTRYMSLQAAWLSS